MESIVSENASSVHRCIACQITMKLKGAQRIGKLLRVGAWCGMWAALVIYEQFTDDRLPSNLPVAEYCSVITDGKCLSFCIIWSCILFGK